MKRSFVGGENRGEEPVDASEKGKIVVGESLNEEQLGCSSTEANQHHAERGPAVRNENEAEEVEIV